MSAEKFGVNRPVAEWYVQAKCHSSAEKQPQDYVFRVISQVTRLFRSGITYFHITFEPGKTVETSGGLAASGMPIPGLAMPVVIRHIPDIYMLYTTELDLPDHVHFLPH